MVELNLKVQRQGEFVCTANLTKCFMLNIQRYEDKRKQKVIKRYVNRN